MKGLLVLVGIFIALPAIAIIGVHFDPSVKGSPPSTEAQERCDRAKLSAEVQVGETVDNAAEVEIVEDAIGDACG